MNRAHALVLVGPMGAGKSVVGAQVARRLGWRFVDVDEQVERRCGVTIAAIFAAQGEPAFRTTESTVLREALETREVVISTGGGAVLDADNRKAMRAAALVVHLHADVDVQLDRLRGETTRPLLAGDDRESRLRALAALRGPLYADVADVRIDTGAMEPIEVSAAVLDALQAARR